MRCDQTTLIQQNNSSKFIVQFVSSLLPLQSRVVDFDKLMVANAMDVEA